MQKMHNTPIINELKKFDSENYIKFFMPGHNQLKQKREYTKIQKKAYDTLNEFNHNIFSYDVTEIKDFDNLAEPCGIIGQSEKNVSSSFDAEDAFFLVNGSTSGVLSMIFAATKPKDKIIIQKNSHKSVHNACMLNNLETVYINQKYNEKFDIFEKIEISEIKEIIQKNTDAKAIVITSPDYFGNDQDIKKIANLAHENDMYLLVDAAHSAHYPYSKIFPNTPVQNGSDMMVSSFHKTLPSFNQTSVLFAGKDIKNINKDKIQESVNLFQTTSPSYVLLSSIEISDFIMRNYGENLYGELEKNIEILKKNLKDCKNINLLENDDISRIVVGFENIDIDKAYSIIAEKFRILPEMANKKSMVFIANIFHTGLEFEKLCEALQYIDKIENVQKREGSCLKHGKKQEIIRYLENIQGRKISQNIYIYPPGTPLIVSGEVVTEKHIEKLKSIENLDSVDIVK